MIVLFISTTSSAQTQGGGGSYSSGRNRGKTREYLGGLITVRTGSDSSYGGSRYYGGGRSNNRHGYQSSGTTYVNEKEGVYIRKDYTLRDILFGGGDGQVNKAMTISQEARQAPKLTTQEMSEQVRRIKAMSLQKQSNVPSSSLEEENTELKRRLAEKEKELAEVKQKLAELESKFEEMNKLLQQLLQQQAKAQQK